MKKLRPLVISICLCFAAVAVIILLYVANRYNILPKRTYSADDFGVETVHSAIDFNQNGIDDYTDIMLGARKDAQNRPKYDGAYFAGGYPPDDIGVCTDVVWRAFKNAGYELREMVDLDISERPDDYTDITTPDKNIDFRRVGNLRVFFEKHALSLTLDTDDISEWQPGDIVIFNGNMHIGIVSDKRNSDGKPYIIHNGGQPIREEDYLKRATVSGHYRFDASRINENLLIKWNESTS